MHETDESLDAKGIAERIPDAKIKTIQNELSRMAREKPRPFVMDSETARKGQPRRYHGMHRRDDVPDDSGNDIGNVGIRPENVREFRSRLADDDELIAMGSEGIEL